MTTKCDHCGIADKLSPHPNTKYCKPCRSKFFGRPTTAMTPEKVEWAISVSGKHTKEEIARACKVSVSTLKRACLGVTFARPTKKLERETISEVCMYYEVHGLKKTQELYSLLNVRSIVESNAGIFKPRKVKWKDDELIQLALMGGLVPLETQAGVLNKGSADAVRTTWHRRFNISPQDLHGMPEDRADFILKPGYPKTKFVNFNLCLWCDAENWLKENLPVEIAEGIRTMARFQRWLFKSDDPIWRIEEMLEDIESRKWT